MTPLRYKMKRPLLRKPSPYAQSFHSGEYHDDPMWVNKDIKNYRKAIQGLSAQLDDLIELTVLPEAIQKLLSGLGKEGETAVSRPSTMGAGTATGGAPGTDPLGKFIAARTGANPAVSRPVLGPTGLATGAPAAGQGTDLLAAAKQKALAAAAVSPDTAKQVAHEAGSQVGGSSMPLLRRAGGIAAGTAVGAGVGYLVNRPKDQQQMNAWLDKMLIEFAYPEEVMKSVWRGLKKPSRKTLGGILRRQGEMRSIPTMVFRNEPEIIGKVRKIDPGASRLSFIERLDALIEFADPRPRNPLGEFTQQGGGPDANAMATTYKAPQIQQQGIGIGKAAGAALAGGALGAVGSNIGKAGYESTVKMIKDLAKRRKKI